MTSPLQHFKENHGRISSQGSVPLKSVFSQQVIHCNFMNTGNFVIELLSLCLKLRAKTTALLQEFCRTLPHMYLKANFSSGFLLLVFPPSTQPCFLYLFLPSFGMRQGINKRRNQKLNKPPYPQFQACFRHFHPCSLPAGQESKARYHSPCCYQPGSDFYVLL